jgi:DNA-directed RNA polymerase subunit M/transcription elongation factor TFIIS
MWCLVLQPKGTTRNATLPADRTEVLDAAGACAILRRATAPELIGTWTWIPKGSGEAMILHLFGYKTGKSGTETTHKFPKGLSIPEGVSTPKPFETLVLYGEAVICATLADRLVSFDGNMFKTFVAEMTAGAGGGADEDEDDEEAEDDDDDAEEEEEEEADDEVVDDDEVAEEDVPDDDDDDETPAKVVVKFVKPKKGTKKIAAWYSLAELKPDSYTDKANVGTLPEARKRVLAIAKARCTFLNAADQVDLERGIYNFTIENAKQRVIRAVWENSEFCSLYEIHARRTISNIDPSSYVGNTRLLTRLQDKEFPPHDLATMAFHELLPEKWGDLIETSIKREAKMLEVDKSMATDMFRCSRCGKRQCTYYEMQTRSADEPMTQFIRCLNCNKQWRQ